MAKVRISRELLEKMVFSEYTNLPVSIAAVGMDYGGRYVVFEIDGPDVPKCEEAIAVMHERRQGRQSLVTMTFEPITDAPARR